MSLVEIASPSYDVVIDIAYATSSNFTGKPVYGRPAEAQARWETAHGRPLPDSIGSRG